jgi:hypothetical protein
VFPGLFYFPDFFIPLTHSTFQQGARGILAVFL